MVMFFSSFLLYLMSIKLFSEVWAVLSSSVWRRLLCHRCARASGCSQRGLCEVCRCSSQHREIRHPAAKNHQACKSDRHVDLSGRYKAPPSCRSVTGAPENRTLSPVELCGSCWRFVSEDSTIQTWQLSLVSAGLSASGNEDIFPNSFPEFPFVFILFFACYTAKNILLEH